MIYKLYPCLWVRVIICITIIIFALQWSVYAQSQQSGDVLRAGSAKVDITPEKPVVMLGYVARGVNLSNGIHDRLYARAVAFENNGKRLLLVSADLGDFYYGTFEYFQKVILDEFNLEPSELFLACTHTHAGPSLTIGKENEFKMKRADSVPNQNNLEYTKSLKPQFIQVIREAFSNMVPVKTGVGVGFCSVGINRRATRPDGSVRIGRNPYGPADKEVLVMKIANPDGSIKNILFNYACHGTSLGSKNFQISGDFLGLAEQFVEKYLGQGIIAPLFAGSSGDINPYYTGVAKFHKENGWIPEPELLGIMLGEEVIHVLRNIKKLNPGGEIETSFKTIKLPCKQLYRGEVLTEETFPMNITAARVGGVAFVGFGTEMLTEIGMAIKAGSPFKNTFVITHCNGASGYLPPMHLYKEGGYEIYSSPFAPQAADMVVKQALKMLFEF